MGVSVNEFRLHKLSLNSSIQNQTPIQLGNIVTDVVIYQSLFSPGMAGKVTLRESLGMDIVYAIHGNEEVELDFDIDSDDPASVSHFKFTGKVVGIKDRVMINDNEQGFVLLFQSSEIVQNLKSKIRRTFKNTTYSKIVNQIYNEFLSDSPMIIESTKFPVSLAISNRSPIDAINWIAKKASSVNYNTGVSYLFFQNNNGYNFMSISKLIEDGLRNPAMTYHYGIKNLSQTLEERHRSMNGFPFIDETDTSRNIHNGLYANKLQSHDIVMRKTDITNFNYFQEFFPEKHGGASGQKRKIPPRLGDGPLTNDLTLGTFSDSYIHYSPKHYSPFDFNINKTNHHEDVVLNRRSKIAQIFPGQSVGMTISIPGDPRRTVGEVVKVMFPRVKPRKIGEFPEPHKYFSGNCLITGVEHKLSFLNSPSMTSDRLEIVTRLELQKDALEEELPEAS